MKDTDCSKCFHYGKSLVNHRVECAIRDKMNVTPAKCHEFVRIEKEGRR